MLEKEKTYENKIAGITALYEAIAYITGIVFFIGILSYQNATNTSEKLTTLLNHQTSTYIVIFLIYILFGIGLIILATILYNKTKEKNPTLSKITLILGSIWAFAVIASGLIYNTGLHTVASIMQTNPDQALTIWSTIGIIFESLGGGSEILGGLWTLLVCVLALKSNLFPKWVNILGIIIGLIGIISIIPGLQSLTGIFGILQITWFVEIGIVFLKRKPKNIFN